MEELRLTSPLSWIDGVDPATGVITQKGHPQRGKNISGVVLRMPYSTGSTVGAYTILRLARAGKSPKKIVLEKPDPVTVSAELAGIPVEVSGAGEAPKLSTEGPEEFIGFLEKEASVSRAVGYVKLKSVHVSGVSYTTIGEAGLEFLEDLVEKGIRFRLAPTTNPAGMDLRRWREMNVPETYAEKQFRIVRALVEMGAIPSLTCTPYLAGNLPSLGEDVCWGESSAVAYANSVLGARTNREGGIKCVVAATIGYTPKYGMHEREERRPSLGVSVVGEVRGRTEFGVLGYHMGEVAPHEVPIYYGVKKISQSELKSMAAGGAASGSIELFHISGITPESRLRCKEGSERIEIGRRELEDVSERLSTVDGEADLVAVGCPHLSEGELLEASSLLEGTSVSVPFWLFTSRHVLSKLEGLRPRVERSGARVYCDTCMVVAPLREMGFRTVATDSAKAARYLKTLQGMEVILKPLDQLVRDYST